MTTEQAPGPPAPPRRRCGHPACDREPYPAGKDWAAFCREHSVPETLDAIREARAASGPELMPDEWPRADPSAAPQQVFLVIYAGYDGFDDVQAFSSKQRAEDVAREWNEGPRILPSKLHASVHECTVDAD